jgi:hypothetical protein
MDDIVNIPVPREHLLKVYGYLADLERRSNGTVDVVEATDADEWPEDLVKRQFSESPESIQRMQRHLAAHSGQEFGTDVLADVMGLEFGWNSVAGALGAYGRRVKNRYDRKTWPFVVRWSHADEKYVYSMTPEVAEIISAL